MKKLLLFFSVLVLAVILISCEDEGETITGTIRYVDVEGGFYGIVSDDGKHYDPVNLEEEYRKDGLKVEFKFKLSKNQVGFHMWGPMVEITSIEKLD